jgi:general secretion pathway protein E
VRAVLALEPTPIDQLADILVLAGQCDARALERGRHVAGETGQRLDMVMLQLGLVSERGMAAGYAELLGLPTIDLERTPLDQPVLPDRLTGRFLLQSRALPVAIEAGSLLVALADPLDRFTPAAIAAATGLRVRLAIAVPIELDAALKRLYPTEADPHAIEETDAGPPLEDDTERLKDLASEAPVIRLVNQIIARAVEMQASDIHIEPFEDRLRVRYRHDGLLQEADSPPPRLAAAITSRIKIMAKLDIADRRLPQDGRIKLVVRGQEVDFRVSTIPSMYGETVVLRVLDRAAVAFDYARLGLSPAVSKMFAEALEIPNGIVLVTGPTGSGKTTTLYTGLLALNAITRKIVTVEDPVEFQLHGINQTQVHTQIGLSFANLLRSILRQNPDVIMVGEIRDAETAQIAVQAALTGHLVLSTLHTNSAAAAITRLRDMGVEDYLLTAVLRGVLAQRLVRRLCTACRQPFPAAPEVIRRFDLDRRCDGGKVILHRAVGCPACRQTGFHGRAAIAEFLTLDGEIKQLIASRADNAAIERAAIAGGMEAMFDAGIAASLAGETTIEEVMLSIRAED